MRIAILDAFSGIAGDMTLGALIDVGLDPEWLRRLPATLGLSGVGVQIREVIRGEIVCRKVDFDIPEQPHGRHIREIRAMVAASGAPPRVRDLADSAFTAIAMFGGVVAGTMWLIYRWHKSNGIKHKVELDHLLAIARSDKH